MFKYTFIILMQSLCCMFVEIFSLLVLKIAAIITLPIENLSNSLDLKPEMVW